MGNETLLEMLRPFDEFDWEFFPVAEYFVDADLDTEPPRITHDAVCDGSSATVIFDSDGIEIHILNENNEVESIFHIACSKERSLAILIKLSPCFDLKALKAFGFLKLEDEVIERDS